MKKLCRILSFFLSFTITLPFFLMTVNAESNDFVDDSDKAKSICLYNINTDKTIYSKNMHERIPPASSVKMMTGVIACELLGDKLREHVEITDEMLTYAEGFSAKLKVGMSVTVENLLYGALCGGGNDAALAIATVCSGSVDAFVELMNKQAKEWELNDTYFTNPTGLDDKEAYTTISDVIAIAKIASEDELYTKISSTPSYVYTPRNSDTQIKLFNRNALISTFYSMDYKNVNANGLIAGNTDFGGSCVVTFAQTGELKYICAVMGAETDDNEIYSYKIANSLISYALNNLDNILIAKKGKVVCYAETRFVMKNRDSDIATVPCVVKDDVYALTFSDIDTTTDLTYRYYLHNEVLNAPVAAGTIVGGVDVLYNGEVIGSATLITDGDVEAQKLLLFMARCKNFFMDRLFWLCIAFFVIIFGIYIYFSELRFRRKNATKLKYRNFY